MGALQTFHTFETPTRPLCERSTALAWVPFMDSKAICGNHTGTPLNSDWSAFMTLTDHDLHAIAARIRPYFDPPLRDIAEELALSIAGALLVWCLANVFAVHERCSAGAGGGSPT